MADLNEISDVGEVSEGSDSPATVETSPEVEAANSSELDFPDLGECQ